MTTCPFSQESFLRPPAPARLALREEFMPGVYGEGFRQEVQKSFPETGQPTIDAIELQRHLTPVIAETLTGFISVEPTEFSAEYCHYAQSLFDVRRGVQSGMLDIAEATYDNHYPPGSEQRTYHDDLAQRYLVAKVRNRYAKITAFDRLKDGVGTAVHVPFIFFDAIEDEAGSQHNLQSLKFDHEAEKPNVAGVAKRSWRVIQAIAQLDLVGYEFLTRELFQAIERGRGQILSYHFNRNSKWLKLLSYNAEKRQYELDLKPQALGRNAIRLSAADKETWEKIKTPGAERLRCPITRMPEELTERYVKFLCDVVVASGVWPSPESSDMQ